MDDFGGMEFAAMIIPIVVGLIVGLIMYVYFSYTLMVIAGKTDTEAGWMAWVPIANMLLMCNIAKKPWWWILIMMFVPLGNVVCIVLLWMAIAERLGKPGWVGILVIVPGVQIAIPAYLAFF